MQCLAPSWQLPNGNLSLEMSLSLDLRFEACALFCNAHLCLCCLERSHFGPCHVCLHAYLTKVHGVKVHKGRCGVVSGWGCESMSHSPKIMSSAADDASVKITDRDAFCVVQLQLQGVQRGPDIPEGHRSPVQVHSRRATALWPLIAEFSVDNEIEDVNFWQSRKSSI